MIAVTGSTGFIGSALVKHIDEPFVAIRSKTIDISQAKVRHNEICEYCDYTSRCIEEIIKKHGVDTIIHLSYIRSCYANDLTTYIENIRNTSSLFEAAKTCGVKNIVFLSSRSVYGKSKSIPTKETDQLNPYDFYSLSKIHCEDIAEYYNSAFDMKIKVVRLAPIYGDGDNSKNLMWHILQTVKDGAKINVYGKRQGRYEYLYVKDAASAIYNFSRLSEIEGVFNLGAGRNYSIDEVVSITQAIKPSLEVGYFPDKKADENIYLMCSKKSYDALNWKPSYDLKSGIEDSLEHDLFIE